MAKIRCRCQKCSFLVEQCVCQWLPQLNTSLNVIVLQDAKEAKHAKNTVPLLRLALPKVQYIEIQDVDAVRQCLQNLNKGEWCLLFPCDSAVPLESISKVEKKAIKGVVLLDATWGKAKKMYLTEALLQSFKTLSFADAPVGQYVIRKSPNAQSLSTLEACAYAIEKITGDDMESLREFMIQAQNWQWRKQPREHKHI